MVGHGELQCAAIKHLLKGDVAALQRLTVQLHRLHVAVLVGQILGDNLKLLAVFEGQPHVLETRQTQDIITRSRCCRIKAHSREHTPSRHLTAILVSGIAVATVSVEVIHHLFHIVLRLGGLADEVIHIHSVVARLIAVGILPDEARDVGLLTTRQVGGGVEQRIKFDFIVIPAAHEIDVTIHILGHEETILIRIGFRQCEINLCGVERTHPATIAATLEELVLRVEDVLVALCTGIELLGDISFTHGLGHASYTPVVVGIFQSLGSGLSFDFDRDVAVFHVGIHAAEIGLRTCHHGFQGFLRVEIADTSEVSIGDNGDGVVTNHAVGLVGCQFPDGQHVMRIGFVFINKGVDEIQSALALHQAEERVQAAEGIPQ